MTSAIFLDVDGVLNWRKTPDRCDGYIGVEDAKVKLLQQLVEATSADIILSSTWRSEWNEEAEMRTHMGRYLHDKLARCGLHIKEATPWIGWSARAKEVKTWIEQNNPDRFIILDDEDFGWDRYNLHTHWVHTDYYDHGLTQTLVNDVLSNLYKFNYFGDKE